MQIIHWVAGLALAFLAFPAPAHSENEPGPVEQITVPKLGRVPYQRLFEMTSEPGESLDAFASRVAPRMRAYTQAEGFEACGVIAADGAGRFGVVIGTNRAHTVCLNFSSMTPQGMTATGETIHNHAPEGAYKANRTDGIVVGRFNVGNTFHRDEPDLFSDEDFKAGDGYMVSPTNLWHQQGVGTVRRVSNSDGDGLRHGAR